MRRFWISHGLTSLRSLRPAKDEMQFAKAPYTRFPFQDDCRQSVHP